MDYIPLECVWQVVIHSRNIYWVKKKIWFFDLKNGFSKFLKPFLTHFDIQTWENDTVRLLWRSQKKFWDLQSKIGSIRLFQMFWGLIWYHSRGHTTKIDFGKRSKLKKKQKCLRSEPFEIIGFTCWPKIWRVMFDPWCMPISNIMSIRCLHPEKSYFLHPWLINLI